MPLDLPEAEKSVTNNPNPITPVKRIKKKVLILGTLVVVAVFILVGTVMAPRTERQQLDALLGDIPPVRPMSEEDNAMTRPFDKDPFNWDGFNQSFADMDKSFARQRQQMMAQMQANMHEMDEFQKRMQASKPYTVSNDARTITITIPLKDKNDALNYQVDIQPNGFVIQHREQQAQGSQQHNDQNHHTHGASQTSVQSFMESFPERLDTSKATQSVRGNQLVVVIPKLSPSDSFQRTAPSPQHTRVYGETEGATSEDAI